MEYTKRIKHQINGIFGEVTYADLELRGHYFSSRHNSEERDVNTGNTIRFQDETNGLPENISMDDYFKMALLQRLGGVEKALKELNIPQIQQTVKIDDESIIRALKIIYGQ